LEDNVQPSNNDEQSAISHLIRHGRGKSGLSNEEKLQESGGVSKEMEREKSTNGIMEWVLEQKVRPVAVGPAHFK
jgi:hypothetical protein